MTRRVMPDGSPRYHGLAEHRTRRASTARRRDETTTGPVLEEVAPLDGRGEVGWYREKRSASRPDTARAGGVFRVLSGGGTAMAKSWEEINARIASGRGGRGDRRGVRRDRGRARASRRPRSKVDVVTTGTFGPMCSSGVFLNFGHSDPPIKMGAITLNDVPAYGGLAAVDTYLGVTEPSRDAGHRVRRRARHRGPAPRPAPCACKATGPGTDCYPRTEIDTWVTLDDLNQAYFFNPRNAYQNYAVAVNSLATARSTRTWGRCCRGSATRRTARRARCRRCSTTRRTARSASARAASWRARRATSRGRARSTTRNQKRDENGVPVGAVGHARGDRRPQAGERRVLLGGDDDRLRRLELRGHRRPDPGARRGDRRARSRSPTRTSTATDLRLRRAASQPAVARAGDLRAAAQRRRSRSRARKVPDGPDQLAAEGARGSPTELKEWVAERGFTLAPPLELLPQPGAQAIKPLEIRTEEAI